MAKKVILDVDPGIDDALALCMALFDPRLDVLAITATAGNVSAEQSTRNVQAIIEQLDPPRWPRIGSAREPDRGLPAQSRQIFGKDGLADAGFEVAELHHRHDSDKVICDVVRDAPHEVTLVALGPLTNVARALRRDVEFATLVGGIHIMGGAIRGGNVTPAAEFNMFCDPESAREVFRSPTTKTMIPLDVTQQVVMTFDQMDELPGEDSRTGRFLSSILPHTFRSYRMNLGLEHIYVHDAVALVAALNPELFEMQSMAADVETGGHLTTGATVFDQRDRPQWKANMEVAVDLEVAAVTDCILRGLKAAGQK